jgi:hypothetical protein
VVLRLELGAVEVIALENLAAHLPKRLPLIVIPHAFSHDPQTEGAAEVARGMVVGPWMGEEKVAPRPWNPSWSRKALVRGALVGTNAFDREASRMGPGAGPAERGESGRS